MPEFKLVQSKKLFQGKLLNVWQDKVAYPDGREFNFEVIKHPGSVVILPVDEQGMVWLVRQYRHPVGGMFLELPAGTIEKGEVPELCAAREIQEEIGMAARHLEKIGKIYLTPGYSDEVMHVFLATGLFESKLDQDDGEFIELEKYTLAELYDQLDQGLIHDGKTAAILGMARTRLMDKE